MAVMAMTLRPDPEMEAALDRLTAQTGQSRQELIRMLVLERDAQTSVAESSRSMKARWGAVLDRLGSA